MKRFKLASNCSNHNYCGVDKTNIISSVRICQGKKAIAIVAMSKHAARMSP